jgi:ribonuclease HI
MVATAPHYLLLTESECPGEDSSRCGCWRFLLRQVDGTDFMEVSETEPDVWGERLQLLSVIRGLEAIGQPSRVTLVTSSQYVSRGIRRDLGVWREMNWTWERFGELHPIKHSSLWRRLDHALLFHTVQCRAWRFGENLQKESVRLSNLTAAASTGSFGTIDRFGRYRRNVLDGWVQLARRMNTRTTTESWAAAH